MSLTFHWFLPTMGDSRNLVAGGHGVDLGRAAGDRPASLGYLTQITRAAEQLGFVGALTPTGAWCDDAWLTTAMLAQASERLKFLVAFRPGMLSPTLAAQMAATFQRHAHDRLLLNVVTGGESKEQRAFGDFLDKEGRYQRTGEFLEVVTRLWRGETVTLDGRHVQVEDAKLSRVPDPIPDVYFGGSSPAAGDVAAKHADVYLTWGEKPEQVRAKIDWIKDLAAQRNRTLRYGIRLHVISRDTSEAAWAEADRLLSALDPATIARVQAGLAQSESEGQRRMAELHDRGRAGTTLRDLEISPNLWAGVGLVRGGAGTALVGSHAEVADRIVELSELGLSEFVLSGYPHLEEAYWFGEGVLPLLRARGLWEHPAAATLETPSVDIPFAGSAGRSLAPLAPQ
ncbi:LLM class flavin-dependent oxidoreductase [Cryptosporangium phraense]|uniref:LLM class flavin-dependent oxidoreductase n=1 Tax=Cryptosporangium phraense TaxID=2593070 RepID=A0A545AMA4_9ACTN|nr:LLM class flavin-dependent oxidoreductase [Cryptosporangium phraense]TQS42462.1 LLM class flavin-dependent oxidoreductase [Cryptosporangium phraense]